MTTWYLVDSGAGAAAANMAIDEALLEFAASLGHPVLRFYGWQEPAATFGYSQHYAEVARWTKLRPLIRRPTGGGLVPHDLDWTYSLIFSAHDPWHALKACDSYRRIHEWIGAAFGMLGISVQLAPAALKTGPGQCFAGAERFDVIWDGRKIAGAAQRRNRLGLLVQGSIQARDLPVSRQVWQSAFEQTLPWTDRIEWRRTRLEELPVAIDLLKRIGQLTAEKYSQASYNERR